MILIGSESEHDKAILEILSWNEEGVVFIQFIQRAELRCESVKNLDIVCGNGTVLIENGFDIGEFVVGIDFVISNGGLLGKLVFEDESFLILLTCILRINHGNF